MGCSACGNTNYRYVTKQITCRNCGGSGKTGDYRCSGCNGSGTVSSQERERCNVCHGVDSNPKKKDGCYITTATLKSLGKDDNCCELEAFRNFRDQFVLSHFPESIKEYYYESPTIKSKIDKCENADQIYVELWKNNLEPAYHLIRNGRNIAAYKLYKNTMIELKKRYS